MRTESNRESRALWIGPGPRLGRLGPLLAVILEGEHLGHVTELAELCAPRPPAGTVVLDADALRAEDVSDVARFLTRSDMARVVLLGDDPGRRGVRGLLRSERVRWIAWPPDVEDLQAIAALARGATPAEHARGETPSASSARAADQRSDARGRDRDAEPAQPIRAHVASALTAEIEEIERVLGTASAYEDEPPIARRPATAPATDAPVTNAPVTVAPVTLAPAAIAPVTLAPVTLAPGTLAPGTLAPGTLAPGTLAPGTLAPARSGDATRDDAQRAPASAANAPSPTRDSPSHATAAPSESFRAQVADLADIAQRIELSLDDAREEPHDPSSAPAALDAVSHEVARLVQFARTLGYLVSPPGPGAQSFDLTEMLEVFLADVRSSGPEAPRCLLRSNGTLPVRSDRQLLSQAFDALFFLARSAAQRGEILRVQALRDEESRPPAARVTIDFPAGQLLHTPTDAILAPYGLRRVFPELGPNALAAATRIIEGQGGQCTLQPVTRARLQWSVSLPLSSTPALTSPSALEGEAKPDLAAAAGSPALERPTLEHNGSRGSDDPFA